MADYEYLTNSGVVVPDTSTLLSDIEAEYLATFGSDLSTDPETPQGVLINTEALARAEVVNNNAALANQINPTIAGGVFLKALCALTGFDPPAGTVSVVAAPNVVLTGVPTSIIPAGSQAKTTAGDIFETTTDVTLDGSGNGTTGAQAIVVGPVPCGAHELTLIETDVLGWETVDNLEAATLGTPELSDQAIRLLRNNTLALQGQSIAEAIKSALSDTPGVKSLQFRENIENTTQTIDGISLVAHSVWACVDGGTDLDVATALLSAKSGGSNWNGATSQVVVEPASGQSYTVHFDRPTAVPVRIQVTAKAPSSSVSPSASIKQAVLDYAAGLLENLTGFVVGGAVSPFEISGAVMQEIPGIFVTKVEVAIIAGSPPFQTTEIVLDLDEIATIALANISVVIL